MTESEFKRLEELKFYFKRKTVIDQESKEFKEYYVLRKNEEVHFRTHCDKSTGHKFSDYSDVCQCGRLKRNLPRKDWVAPSTPDMKKDWPK